ncbi:hypothetical protein E2C00_32475 [Streptomyces sp. WAC05374]|uniref:hypothetical protein n=1 Tax=Streptomyces sp. WAC05374 TaxID=2487420 RepID=UPI000F85D6DE|nr:hypothetical protein [Streptomyces sp. WAC05374]RST19093.1 hypothetical protein EF905_02950 [Streptomyces sp. WAC05374]TDF36939.1 hypothetical protein E2B92_30125 [Streptomyces sp. WAC05374]TDF46434.1 hypothetical protein E2C02_31770 [Streptomyces sp. WAC05374]TDF47535.1 hypothetical protein E2C00_32475 [Streptomyces sp. WAC05374]
MERSRREAHSRTGVRGRGPLPSGGRGRATPGSDRFSGIVLALVGAMGTAWAAPAAADTSVRAAAAAGGHAAPTMVHCRLKVRAGATTSSSALRTLYNRNGSCPGSSGHDSIPCWLANCGGTIKCGTYVLP